MRYFKLFSAVLAVSAFSLAGATPADAQARRGTGAVTRAVPRSVVVPGGGVGRRVIVGPRFVGSPFIGSFYGPFYPYGLSIGLGFGYPYGYPYAGYGYYGAYGYPYGGAGYISAVPGGAYGAYGAYGAVRIEGAPRKAQVFADGYYVGIVDDFDGAFHHMNLTPGAHRIEIRPSGASPIAFDVSVQPGQTITYHADQPRN